MAVADQLNINTGTESSPNYVLHNLQDYRLNHLSTLTTTISDIIGRNGSTFGAITPANLASVLGAANASITSVTDPDAITSAGQYQSSSWNTDKCPSANGILIVPFYNTTGWRFQMFYDRIGNDFYVRSGSSQLYTSWVKLAKETS